MDMTSMPVELTQGRRAFSVPTAFSCMPNAFGMEGPVMSASKMADAIALAAQADGELARDH